MRRFKLYKLLIFITVIVLCFVAFSACTNDDNEIYFEPNVSSVGVWWWDHNLGDEYLEFADKNGVTEIYYSVPKSQLENNAKPFILKAKDKGIKVYWLLGDYRWIHDDADFDSVMAKYTEYQEAASESERFYGVHMDVEPHQDPSWRTNRAELLKKYIDFLAATNARYPDITFDWDIPAWFNDTVNYKDTQTELYKAVIQEANRAFIMSYRDTAEKMVNFSTVKEQVTYAKSQSKQIFLSAECSAPDEEGIAISFKNKGKAAMYTELNKLKELTEYDNLGISIHHIKSWFGLKD